MISINLPLIYDNFTFSIIFVLFFTQLITDIIMSLPSIREIIREKKNGKERKKEKMEKGKDFSSLFYFNFIIYLWKLEKKKNQIFNIKAYKLLIKFCFLYFCLFTFGKSFQLYQFDFSFVYLTVIHINDPIANHFISWLKFK